LASLCTVLDIRVSGLDKGLQCTVFAAWVQTMQASAAKISTEGEGDVGILQDQDQSMNQARGTNRPTGEGGEV